MPSKNRRMALTLSPELDAALKDLSESTGVAASSFVVQMLTDALPQIRLLAHAARQVKNSPVAALEVLAGAITEAQAHAAQMGLEIQSERKRLRAAPNTSKGRKVEGD